ncbi:MAG TPA: hypothetical protein VL625_06300 [Patescibacteria group bacterium]|jgi:hypothetical protein|nr:hypothetical protein [Patescibacteria group bacterium]
MAFSDPEEYLPKNIIKRARLSGDDHAWRIKDIPDVIEAARVAGVLNIGGQLQFIIPEESGGGICECYWIEVDTYKHVRDTLPWEARVAKAAEVALVEFEKLKKKHDFLKEGRKFAGGVLTDRGKPVTGIEDMMWFVWYIEARETAN